MARTAHVLTIAALVAACGGRKDSAADAAVALVDGAPGPDAMTNLRTGLVQITESRSLVDSTRRSALSGAFDATGLFYEHGWGEDRSAWHHLVTTVGDCSLYEIEVGFCESCTGICAQSECHPWPQFGSVGAIELAGLSSGAQLEYQFGPYVAAGELAEDLFSADDSITASAPGHELPGFAVSSSGVDELITSLGGLLELRDEEDALVTWTPAEGDARIRLVLLPVKFHAVPISGIIECDVPDAAGAVTVAKELIAAFPKGSTVPPCDHGCPPSRLARYRRAEASQGDGHVELLVENQVEFYLSH